MASVPLVIITDTFIALSDNSIITEDAILYKYRQVGIWSDALDELYMI